MAAKALVPFLVAMMLLTGVCNTLLTKYQDNVCVRNCDAPKHKDRDYFEQPVIQTLQMFIGEMACWIVVGGFTAYQRYASRKAGYEAIGTEQDEEPESPVLARDQEDSDDSAVPIANPLKPAHAFADGRVPLTGRNILLLALPACCDIAGTTLMNVGLLFVAASIYQMTRGALVLFVGLFSVLFLKRRLGAYKWFALFIVVAGVAVVGLAGALAKGESVHGESLSQPELRDAIRHGFEIVRRAASEIAASPSAGHTVLGVFLIAGAQIFTATQFVLEESIMERYAMEPIKVVSWEGTFGFIVTVIGMIVLHFAVGITKAGSNGYFDAREGLWEITHFRSIAVSSVLIMISIGGFNFFGLSVTRTVSATSRSTIDTCRTLFIWIVSLGLGWETFKWLQVVGFGLLVYGTFLFNDIVRPPLKRWVERRPEELLPETPIEHN
ncbi:uncharacterized protein BDZ99DRAFT_565308 [Mytilinidion resinicola]|uniref:Integral membrane protein n=1 Tax=Mytilinidion resinicola TaxID=574789 RepID=A0A6A6Z997_9PEZI|nr:uncharacterized protein BDZ99DRAFT_565308 [Mytilinidion resinicola]KAF2817586.1 integral membrane protein [Mytilinidion resinicola]